MSVCQNWHRGHPEAALKQRLPSLVCVLTVVSRFQMKSAKCERNEIHKPVAVKLSNRKMLLVFHQLAFTCLPPCSAQLSLLPWKLMNLFLCSAAAASSVCRARPFNWFLSLDFGQASPLAAATGLPHRLF